MDDDQPNNESLQESNQVDEEKKENVEQLSSSEQEIQQSVSTAYVEDMFTRLEVTK